MLKSPCRPTPPEPGLSLIQFQNSVMASMPPGCSMNSSASRFSPQAASSHQTRRHAQVDLRPLRDLQLEQLADVHRAAVVDLRHEELHGLVVDLGNTHCRSGRLTGAPDAASTMS